MSTDEVQSTRCRVSVIMLTIDRPQYIESAIASVLGQTLADWELIIVHDGGDERMKSTVKRWLAVDARIRYLPRDHIGNIANALNYGIGEARGEYIAILDDDDAWLDKRKIELQVTALAGNAGLAAVGGGAVVVDHSGAETMHYNRPSDPAECARRALVANPLIHSTVLFRRSSAEAVGLYDESLAGYQDWDLWLKLMRKEKVTNLPYYFATYRIWDGGGSSTKIMGNAWSSVRIVARHRAHYPGALFAMIGSLCYVAFALLPAGIRRRFYQALTRLKKSIFS